MHVGMYSICLLMCISLYIYSSKSNALFYVGAIFFLYRGSTLVICQIYLSSFR